jgi:hypothetical protein
MCTAFCGVEILNREGRELPGTNRQEVGQLLAEGGLSSNKINLDDLVLSSTYFDPDGATLKIAVPLFT